MAEPEGLKLAIPKSSTGHDPTPYSNHPHLLTKLTK